MGVHGTGGSDHQACRFGRFAAAMLLAGAAMPGHAAEIATAANASADQPTSAQSTQQEIVVTAPPLFRDIQPERSLDEAGIESYGVSTVDDLLGEVQGELGGDDEQPLILVNGQRVNDISDVGALPVEALRNVQVLPKGSALRAGGTSTQRVISLTLKRDTRSATLTAAHKLSTDGGWNAERSEAIITHVHGDTRANLGFRVRDESSLLESERGLIQPLPALPYALQGNIIGYPSTLGEIDPALSALAGTLVTVVPMPSSGVPTLADLAAFANQSNVTNVGEYRTLRPQVRNYDLNGSVATRLAPWLTSNATLHWGHNESRSLRGLPSAIFVLSPANPFSPFSDDAGLAFYGNTPFRGKTTRDSFDGSATFNANWGSWDGNLNLRHNESRDVTLIDQRATFGAIDTDDTLNPFTADLADMIDIRTNRTLARSSTSVADLTVNGPVAKLPAGDLLAVVEGRLAWNHLRSENQYSPSANRTFDRAEQSIRGALEVPLASRDNKFLPEIGNLDASVEYSRAHFSDAGSINHYTLGLTWEPAPILRLHASFDETDAPAPIQTLGNPVNVVPGVRVFDPLTGETVDVTQISGGNPDLLPESTKIRNVSALLRLVPRLNLQLNAEYTDADRRNFVSALPEASAAVMQAFPERFVRDANGLLTTVDLRPVNFDSHREQRLRWGLSMKANLTGKSESGKRSGRSGPPTYLQLTANHSAVFSDTIRIRPGLDPVDLLEGGAIGLGGGRVRHQLDGTASITSGGLGGRIGVTWRGSSTLDSRIGGNVDTLRFSSLLLINARAFVDLKKVLPQEKWAKSLRLSLNASNLTNAHQHVYDSLGATPLQYQPAYRDALGRTIEFEIRKVF